MKLLRDSAHGSGCNDKGRTLAKMSTGHPAHLGAYVNIKLVTIEIASLPLLGMCNAKTFKPMCEISGSAPDRNPGRERKTRDYMEGHTHSFNRKSVHGHVRR